MLAFCPILLPPVPVGGLLKAVPEGAKWTGTRPSNFHRHQLVATHTAAGVAITERRGSISTASWPLTVLSQ